MNGESDQVQRLNTTIERARALNGPYPKSHVLFHFFGGLRIVMETDTPITKDRINQLLEWAVEFAEPTKPAAS